MEQRTDVSAYDASAAYTMFSFCKACKAIGVAVQPEQCNQALICRAVKRGKLLPQANSPGLIQFTRPRGAILTISFLSESMTPPIIADFVAA